eukprot:7168908-Prymnesium_polylepis.1
MLARIAHDHESIHRGAGSGARSSTQQIEITASRRVPEGAFATRVATPPCRAQRRHPQSPIPKTKRTRSAQSAEPEM